MCVRGIREPQAFFEPYFTMCSVWLTGIKKATQRGEIGTRRCPSASSWPKIPVTMGGTKYSHGIDPEVLLRSGPYSAVWFAMDGTLIEINDTAAQGMGASREALIGRSCWDLFPELADTLRARFEQVAASDGPLTFVDEVPLPSGVRVFESIDTPIRDASGRCIAMQVYSVDVTERLETERALDQAELKARESERRFAEAMEAVRDGVWDWNVRTNDFYVSASFFRQLGYTEEDLHGHSVEWFFNVLHPEDRDRVRAEMEAHFRGETPEYRTQFRWRHKDGDYRWTLVRGRAVECDEDGAAVRIVGTSIDTTERRALESRLLEAEKMEAIGRLAGGVAHDFNNLLTAVTIRIDMLHELPLPQEAIASLEQISAAAERASRLTLQLLSFARRRLVEPEAVAVDDVLEDLQTLLESILPSSIELRMELGAPGKQVMFDLAQLEQIVVNLTINARNAMPNGGTLTLSTAVETIGLENHTSEEAGVKQECVVVRVRDTGVGMDEATASRIFEPFFTTKDGSGNGLGLASSYGIVRQAHGDIRVESEPGSGSCFVVVLPLSSGASSAEEKPSGELVSVLLVEDDDMVREPSVRVLERHGFLVRSAASAEEALEIDAASSEPPTVLVTDMMMPGMNGRALTEKLRARHPSLRVLLISGYTDGEELRELSNHTATEFLAKPFSAKTLVRSIQDLVSSTRS